MIYAFIAEIILALTFYRDAAFLVDVLPFLILPSWLLLACLLYLFSPLIGLSNIDLEDDTISGPVANRFYMIKGRQAVKLSEIDISQSRLSFFWDSYFMLKNRDRLVVSLAAYPWSEIRDLFAEVRKRVSQLSDAPAG